MNRFSHAIAGLATASPWRAGAASRPLKARLQAAGAPPDAVRRASDAFAMDSVPGRGTRVWFTVYL